MSRSTPRYAEPRRVIVAPHNFEIGGSQINALELAGEIARRPEFEVILYAPDGALTERAKAMGLELHLTSLRESAPSPRRIRELSKLAKKLRADLVHAYEWAPTVDAAYGVAWQRAIPVLSTIMSMEYPYFLPKRVPSIVGTRELLDLANTEGRTAYLLEPPVDTTIYRPDALPPGEIAKARQECGARPNDCLVVVVTRLAASLKLDGLLALIRAVGILAKDRQLALTIVGEGPVRDQVERLAIETNLKVGREVVRLIGERHDPIPYYLAADVSVGMGSSALRAMATAKPLLVQGERGFWAIANQQTLPMFAAQGWYGIGNGRNSTERCVTELARLVDADDTARRELGEFGRNLVVQNYSLTRAADQLAHIYSDVIARPAPTVRERVVEPLQMSVEIAKYFTSLRFPWLRTASRRLLRR